MILELKKERPFARGGNRLCYVHPADPNRCIKVRRPDFTLADRRRKKGFPKNLRPLIWFDDNREEFRVMTGLSDKYGDRLFQHVSRCYGFEQTDLGPGLTSELIRDKDGRISRTLKKYLWDYGLDRELQEGIDDLEAFWTHEGIPSRDLLLHNIVVQMADEKVIRLVVIDGLGSAGVVPEQVLPSFWGNRKARRKIKNFHSRIESFLGQRGHGEFPGFHGLLLHDGREEQK